jgi:S-formylglutathione hydrolase FrmB
MTTRDAIVRRRRLPRVVAMLTVLLAASAVVQGSGTAPAGAAPPPLPSPDAYGITLQSWTQVDAGQPASQPRLLDATLTTTAVFPPGGGSPGNVPIRVRILLPANYTTDRSRPYPTLYLLHGGAADWQQWSDTSAGDVDGVVAGSPFRGIVVMPEGGYAGWYSDWYGTTDGGFRPLWETFHVHQLVRWIDTNLNTVAQRSGRAVAGVSMGGYGALRYAGRFSSTFGAVGAMSAGIILDDSALQTVSDSMWALGASVEEHGRLDGGYRVNPPWWQVFDATRYRAQAVFGPEADRAAVTPYDMAAAYNAYDGRFALYTGTTGGDQRHAAWSDAFHAELGRSGVAHRYCRGPGDHSFDHWRNDLADFLHYAFASTPGSCPNGWGAPIP